MNIFIMDDLNSLLKGFLADIPAMSGASLDRPEDVIARFDDERVAAFIALLITARGGIDSSLLGVVEKMLSGRANVNSIARAVSEVLIRKDFLNKDRIAEFQISARELMKGRANNRFISEIYRLSVEIALTIDLKTDSTGFKLFKLVEEYKLGITGGAALERDVYLFLNLILAEDDAGEKRKLASRLAGYLAALVEHRNIRVIADICRSMSMPGAVYAARSGEGPESPAGMIMGALNGTVSPAFLANLIEGEDADGLSDIAYVFSAKGGEAVDALIDAFLYEQNIFVKDKYFNVFSGPIADISPRLAAKLLRMKDDPIRAKELVNILKAIDIEKAKSVSGELLASRDPDICLKAIEIYEPVGHDGIGLLKEIIRKSRNKKVREAALRKIVGTRNWAYIKGFFEPGEDSGLSTDGLFPELVRSSGDSRINESVPYLSRILMKSPVFGSVRRDELRLSAVVSLGQIHTAEAIAAIREGMAGSSGIVKKMCEVILKMEKEK
ncbi:MAG: hypothetical protein HQL30_04705 [Candidatus Omnitrophica bacterium]|nr:hypothetical protein [Candidatus Omnitrophota bacterium]